MKGLSIDDIPPKYRPGINGRIDALVRELRRLETQLGELGIEPIAWVIGAQMAEQIPSIGRVVHYVYGDQHCAAIVTDPAPRLPDGDPLSGGQSLVVFPPNYESFTTIALHDEAGAPATWHWPEYVPAQ